MVNRAVIVFLRVPEKGRVKTRLSRFLDDNFVLDLYRAFVEDTLSAIKGQGEPYLCFWPPQKKTILSDWLGKGCDFHPQKGDDLGQKMANAFKDVFAKDVDQVMLIGTDIPQLDSNTISLGFKLLEEKSTVIGPSKDGGYYLIGFNKLKFSETIFQNITWSTPNVFDQTLKNMKQLSIVPGLLPMLNDVDTLIDLEKLANKVKQGGFVGPRTRQLIVSDANGIN